MVATLQCHSNAVSRVVWTPCGSRILSSSYDGTVSMWDPEARIEVFNRKQARAILVDNVAISNDSRFIAAASADYGLHIWDSVTGASYERELQGDKILWLSFARRDRRIITATGAALFIWKWESHSTLSDMNRVFSPSAVDPTARAEFVALSVSDDDGSVAYRLSSAIGLWVHNIEGDVTRRLCATSKATHIAWSFDMQHIACFSAATDSLYVLETYIQDAKPRIFHASGQPLAVTTVAFSPDNSCIATGSMDHSLRIWNVALGHCTRVLHHPTLLKGVSSIAYSPDGRYVAAGSYDGTVRVWDVEDSVWLRYDDDESRAAYPSCSTGTARWADLNRVSARYQRMNLWPQRRLANSTGAGT